MSGNRDAAADLALCEAATPGPWHAGREDMTTLVNGFDSKYIYGPGEPGGRQYLAIAYGEDVSDWGQVMANARLIAAAPTALRYWINESERLRADLAKERAHLDALLAADIKACRQRLSDKLTSGGVEAVVEAG